MKTSLFLLLRASLLIALVICVTHRIYAQVDTTAIRFGLSGAYLFNQHRANFETIPGIASCCPHQYGGANSQGFGGGVLAEYPITRLADFATLSLSGRASYFQGLGASLTALETVRIQGGNALIRHELESRLNALVFEPMLTVRYFKRLTVSLGMQIGTFFQPSYQYTERILEPADITYADGQRTFNASADALSNVAPMQMSLLGGAALELQVNRTGTILPTLEAFYSYPLTSIARSVDWRVATLRLGVSLRYSPYRTTDLTAEEIEQRYQDSLKQVQAIASKALAEAKEARKKELTAKIGELQPVYFGEGDEESELRLGNQGSKLQVQLGVENFTIQVSKIPTTLSVALIPRMFFAENSALLPSRYKVFSTASEAQKFSTQGFTAQAETLLPQKIALQVYYQILNIIGKRLQERPEAIFTITGIATNTEENPKRLATARANTVSAYLQDIWRIPSSRIRVMEQILTANTSGDEQYRVEFSASDEAILQANEFHFTKSMVSPEGLELSLQISAGQGLKQWDLEISQLTQRESLTLHSYQGGTSYPQKYLWDIRKNPPVSTEDIALKLSIDDATNNKFEAPIVSLHVQNVATTKNRQTFIVFPKEFSQVLQKHPIFTDRNTTKYRIMAKLAEGNKALETISTQLPIQPSVKPTLFDTTTPEGKAYNDSLILECIANND